MFGTRRRSGCADELWCWSPRCNQVKNSGHLEKAPALLLRVLSCWWWIWAINWLKCMTPLLVLHIRINSATFVRHVCVAVVVLLHYSPLHFLSSLISFIISLSLFTFLLKSRVLCVDLNRTKSCVSALINYLQTQKLMIKQKKKSFLLQDQLGSLLRPHQHRHHIH